MVSFLVAIATIPITLPYLGAERFGMWMTMNSFVSLLGLANLGVGLSLMNAIARQDREGAVTAQRTSTTNALAISIVVALVVLLVAIVVIPLVPWWRVLNVSSSVAATEAGPSVVVITTTFLLGMPLGLATSVWNGLQQTYVAGLLFGLGPLLGIAGVAAGVLAGQGVPVLVLAASGGPLVAAGIGAAILLIRRPALRPSLRLVSTNGVRALLSVGVGFFLLQVAIAVATSSDQLVLAQVIGPAAVAEYSVVSRLFNVPLVLAVTVVTVLWPGLSEARSRGDHEWVATAHRRVVFAACGITVPLVAVLVVGGPIVTHALAQGDIDPGFGLFLAFALATLAVVVASTQSVFLNSAGVVWPLVLCWGTMAVCNIALGIWLSARAGTSGVVWATAITAGAMLIPLAFLGRRVPEIRVGDAFGMGE